jgi:hypothetical protein
MAAIGMGARLVLTSRSYIYQDARRLLKEYSYPRLREQQVTVDVEDLSPGERRQILYNHIAYGDQPPDVRRAMKPFLDRAAEVRPFRPEMARRLGQRAFTTGLSVSEPGIETFMARPRQLLRDVYSEFGADEQAALTLVYAAAGKGHLQSPLALDVAQCDIIARAGSTPAGAARALESLTGSFLSPAVLAPTPLRPLRAAPFSPLPGEPPRRLFTWQRTVTPGWAFRHPTLFEGFAAWLSAQPHLLSVVLAGLSDDALLASVDCATEDASQANGILLRMPPALYRGVAERVAAIAQRSWQQSCRDGWEDWRATQRTVLGFLASRSSDAFLSTYLHIDPGLPARLTEFPRFASFVEGAPEPDVLARLYQAHLLPERIRLDAVEQMTRLAIGTPDAGWLHIPAWQILLKPPERARLIERVRQELVPQFGTDQDPIPAEREEHEDPFERALYDYQQAFEEAGDAQTAAAFAAALEAFLEQPITSPDDWQPDWDQRSGASLRRQRRPASPPSRTRPQHLRRHRPVRRALGDIRRGRRSAERAAGERFEGGRTREDGREDGRVATCPNVRGSTTRSTCSWRNSPRPACTSIGNVPVS